jgi:predicted acylesterase/phospholipase RssA
MARQAAPIGWALAARHGRDAMAAKSKNEPTKQSPNNPTGGADQLKILKIGLALSGGGAKGDFEVGAVRYLYDFEHVHPAIITGTSVGSIAALKLAEGEPKGAAKPDASGHIQGLAGLEQIWLSLNKNADMWEEAFNLDSLGDSVKSLLTDIAATAIAGVAIGPIGLLAWVFSGGDSDVDKVKAQVQKLLGTRSLADLGPIGATMQKASSLKLDLIKASGKKLRMAAVALEDGRLRYITETGAVIERDGKPTMDLPIYDPKCAAPLQKQIAEIEGQIKEAQESAFDPKDPQKGSLAGVAAMRNKEAKLKQQLAKCPKKQNPLMTTLLNGALASSSIPFVFPPVKIGQDWYIDGGVRMVAPIEGALRAGAEKVYAVVAGSPQMQPQHSLLNHNVLLSYDPPANLLDVGARASEDIMPDEIQESELLPPNGWGAPVVVVQPEYDIHDGMTIDPGLIRIRMAHGFMRADDVCQAYQKDPANYRKLADGYSRDRQTTAIVRLRRKLWVLEYAANGLRYNEDDSGRPAVPSPLVLNNPNAATQQDEANKGVRHWKRELKEIVDQRIAAGGRCPADMESWWMDWERHPWPPTHALWDASNPFVPLKHMQVSVSPAMLPLEKPVTFTVSAKDNGATIADVNVYCNGQKIGTSGKPIHFTFPAKTKSFFDPEIKKKITEKIPPSCSVVKSGYYAEYPFSFNA